MAAQIRHLVSGLQNHTRRLETITTLNEHLTAILNLEELLVEVVDQIKDKFGYYQVHIYLFDNEQEKLVIAAGTGQASEDLKTIDYTISMNLQTSPVARAAYTGKIVTVGDVSQTEAWLPTPSLPHAYAEMAVPITLGLEGQVVGVLHVQGGQTAGLDENDANLLRSLANQVAVAIRNARLFQEVEIALAKAQATQERYIEQTWRKESRVVAEKGEYYYIGPNATALDEAKKRTLAEAKQQAFVQARPAIVALGENDSQKPNVFEAEMSGSVIAPITLGGKAIGALHLHPGANSRRWTENDLTMIETIINQLAQRAENLRLFEETRERASYERLVGEMTQKIRQSPNLKVLTQTAAEVLNEVLGAAGGEVRLNLSPPAKGGNGHVG
jgi:GAF domain-containing protein